MVAAVFKEFIGFSLEQQCAIVELRQGERKTISVILAL